MNWFVVFHPKEKKHWWAGRFSHVSLAGFSNETWTHLDLKRGGVDVRVFYAYDDVQDYLSFLSAYHVVLKFGLPIATGKEWLRPMTCVGFVKHVLGVRSRALLPDQLFEILIRDNKAELINDPEGTRRDSRPESPKTAG